MKKTICLIVFFIIYTALIISCPLITSWDKSIIMQVQALFKDLPLIIPTLPDCILYSIMIAIPIIGLGICFIKNKRWFDFAFISLIPLITYLLNCLMKPIVHRNRPPFELQIGGIHPDSFSYVSSHSLVTFCLWAMVIYYAYKGKWRGKELICAISILWILFVGFSRVWLGVHNPTDVIGAYILGFILISLFVNLKERL